MVKSVYEGMFLLDSNRFARDANGVSGQIPELVKQCGGEVLVSRLWSEQKLAFPIRGHRKGTYWLTYFRMDRPKVSEFKRKCALNGDILRNLIISVDERLVDALVTHAESGGRSSSAEEDSATDSPRKTPRSRSRDTSDEDASDDKNKAAED